MQHTAFTFWTKHFGSVPHELCAIKYLTETANKCKNDTYQPDIFELQDVIKNTLSNYKKSF